MKGQFMQQIAREAKFRNLNLRESMKQKKDNLLKKMSGTITNKC